MFGIRQSRISEDGVSERQLARARWDSLLDPGLLRAVLIHPTMLPLNELHRYIRLMRDNGQSAIDYEVAFWSKLATPPATLVMLFLSVPFVLAHSRFVSIGQRIFLGIVFGMAFYMLNRGMSYVALVYGLNPVVSALIPAAAFLAIAVFMIRRVR
jgi:lipopolysaccharide export system permease protein